MQLKENKKNGLFFAPTFNSWTHVLQSTLLWNSLAHFTEKIIIWHTRCPSGVFALNFAGEFEYKPFSYPIKCGCVRGRSWFSCLLTHFAQRIFLVQRTALEFWRNNTFSMRTIRVVFPHPLVFVHTVDLLQLSCNSAWTECIKSAPRVFGVGEKWWSLFAGHIPTDRKALTAVDKVGTFPHT